MPCGGCGKEKRPGDEQPDFAREHSRQVTVNPAALEMNRRVNRCYHCDQWGGFWKCGQFATSLQFLRMLQGDVFACPLSGNGILEL